MLAGAFTAGLLSTGCVMTSLNTPGLLQGCVMKVTAPGTAPPPLPRRPKIAGPKPIGAGHGVVFPP